MALTAGHFKPPSDPDLRDQVRRQLGIDGAAAVVIFIGSGFARKGAQGTNRSLADVGGTALPNRRRA